MTQDFAFGNVFLVPLTPSGTKGPQALIDGKIKPSSLRFRSSRPGSIPERAQPAHPPQTLTGVAVAHHAWGGSCGPVP